MKDLFLQADFIQELDYLRILFGIVLCIGCTYLIKRMYSRRSSTFENKEFFSKTLYIFAISVLLIVLTIKSSLALSLGMVGALSVIRFRTAIKEPEQLTTLLMTLAVAIAIAAEKEILAVMFMAVYMVIYPKKKTTAIPHDKKRVFQVFLDRNADQQVNINDFPPEYLNKLNRISNVNNTMILEFLIFEQTEVNEILNYFNKELAQNVEYELN